MRQLKVDSSKSESLDEELIICFNKSFHTETLQTLYSTQRFRDNRIARSSCLYWKEPTTVLKEIMKAIAEETNHSAQSKGGKIMPTQ